MKNALLLFSVLLVGCGPDFVPPQECPIPIDTKDYVLVFAIDPAYRQRMKDGDGIFTFICDSTANFFTERIGENNDELVLATLTPDPMRWRGAPAQVKMAFSDAAGLASYLKEDRGECRSYGGVADVMEYLRYRYQGNTKICLVVISPMTPQSEERQRLLDEIKQFDGWLYMTWVDHKNIKELQSIYAEAGIPCPVFTDILGDYVEPLKFGRK